MPELLSLLTAVYLEHFMDTPNTYLSVRRGRPWWMPTLSPPGSGPFAAFEKPLLRLWLHCSTPSTAAFLHSPYAAPPRPATSMSTSIYLAGEEGMPRDCIFLHLICSRLGRFSPGSVG